MRSMKHKVITDTELHVFYKEARLSNILFCSDILNEFCRNGTLYWVRGLVEEHTDGRAGDALGFPEWSYILVLRCGQNVFLMQEGYKNLRVAKGMLIELRSWSVHALAQTRKQKFVWYAIDSTKRLSLEVVRKTIIQNSKYYDEVKEAA
jgi:hypothetical protein